MIPLLNQNKGDNMRKFWSFISNGLYSIGCSGQTAYVYDKDKKELAKFKDIKYGYTPMFAPDGKTFVVKSTAGQIAVYSLETLSLMHKFYFSSIKMSQDDGFCFSPDGKLFFNIERHGNTTCTALAIYDTEDYSRQKLLTFENIVLDHIEYDAECNAYYVLGFKRGLIDAFSHAFVAKFENDSLKKITRISEDEHTFYRKYKSLQLGGFTEEAFKWKYMDCDLEDIRSKDYKLSGLIR